MDRRNFIRVAAGGAALLYLGGCQEAYNLGRSDREVGKRLRKWKKGQFQVHFIYTGVSESMFMIFPDATTMLLDCGDHNAIGRGKLAVPVLPDATRHAGDWIRRYVERVNPGGSDVDYMMLSHYHSDHAGDENFHDGLVDHGGKPYPLTGFLQAGEHLRFHRAIDRAYPGYDDPLPLDPASETAMVTRLMDRLYEWKGQTQGLEVERFRLGARDQVRLLRHPEDYPSFFVTNITQNGRILRRDGTVRDLYRQRIEAGATSLNENGMSLGMMFHYGDFRFFTAGDFSDHWTTEDGTVLSIEEELAKEVETAHVSKINHHGHHSMPLGLVSALRSRVYVSCVWDQLHNTEDTCAHIMSPEAYQGERLICPGIFPAERRQEDQGKPWLGAIEQGSYEGGHVVLTVEKGGKHYSLTYVSAQDEQMTVRSVIRYQTQKEL